MEERNTNIEQWLREAAAKQEQEQTPAADRQAAWEAMHKQLDQPPRRGISWKRWFGGSMLAGVVLFTVLYVVLNRKANEAATKKENSVVTPAAANGRMDRTGEATSRQGSSGKDAHTDLAPSDAPSTRDAGDDTAGSSTRESKGNAGKAIAPSTGKDAGNGTGVENNIPAPSPGKRAGGNAETAKIETGNIISPLTAGKHAQANTNKPPGQTGPTPENTNGIENTGSNPPATPLKHNVVPGSHNGNAPTTNTKKTYGANIAAKQPGNNFNRHTKSNGFAPASSNTGVKAAPSNNNVKYNNTTAMLRGSSSPGSSKKMPGLTPNDRSNPGPTYPVAKKSANLEGKKANTENPAIGRLSPQSIVTPAVSIRRFNTTPDTKLVYARSRVQGEAPAFTPFEVFDFIPSGVSVKISGNVPVSGTFGGNAAVEYTINFGDRFRVRPHIDAGYLTGFSEQYKHHTFNTRRVNPGSDQKFWVDSIITTYTATTLGYGEVGVQLGYGLGRWEAMAGLSYQYVFHIKGKEDSVMTSRQDSIQKPEYSPRFFSTGDLPGNSKLMLQTGINYMFTPQLQVGFRYNLLLMSNRAGSGIIGNPSPLPLRSSCEVQVRWYFRRSERE